MVNVWGPATHKCKGQMMMLSSASCKSHQVPTVSLRSQTAICCVFLCEDVHLCMCVLSVRVRVRVCVHMCLCVCV